MIMLPISCRKNLIFKKQRSSDAILLTSMHMGLFFLMAFILQLMRSFASFPAASGSEASMKLQKNSLKLLKNITASMPTVILTDLFI